MQALEADKKAEAAKNKAADGPQLVNDDADDLDPNQYYERRVRTLAAAKASGRNPYPHKFQISMYLPEYVAKYKDLEPGSHQTEEVVSVAGAIFCYQFTVHDLCLTSACLIEECCDLRHECAGCKH